MPASSLTLVRHGESIGNVAADAAHVNGALDIEVPARDADVTLSDDGLKQAEAWGNALTADPDRHRFDSLWCSPFRRARQSAEVALETAGISIPTRIDERLRDRDLGILDALTSAGVQAHHPDEARRRHWLGKFYHRPPGGESWADVIARVRSLLRDVHDEEDGRDVLIVCHDVVIMSIRYVVERMTEESVLSAARDTPVLNMSVTRYERSDTGGWRLDDYNDVAHLEQDRAPVTRHAGDRHRAPQ